MKIVENWRTAWKWFSIQLIAIGGAVQLAVLAFPTEIKGWLPDNVTHYLAIGLLALAALGRLVDQSKPE